MFKRALFIIFSVLVIVNIYGCAVGAIGMYEAGRAARDFNAPYNKVFEAAKSAFVSLGITLKGDTMEKETAKVKGVYNDGKYVNVAITNVNGSSSTVEVQVGSITSPDKERAVNILDTIGKQLGL
ncbi:MAG: DUF3568 family protein [Candidatus Omnitrophota bacterium]